MYRCNFRKRTRKELLNLVVLQQFLSRHRNQGIHLLRPRRSSFPTRTHVSIQQTIPNRKLLFWDWNLVFLFQCTFGIRFVQPKFPYRKELSCIQGSKGHFHVSLPTGSSRAKSSCPTFASKLGQMDQWRKRTFLWSWAEDNLLIETQRDVRWVSSWDFSTWRTGNFCQSLQSHNYH